MFTDSCYKDLLKNVEFWDKLFCKFPYYFFYYYLPYRREDASVDSKYAQNLVYRFKDGSENETVLKLVSEKLLSTFKSCKNLTFANIPASTIHSNTKRYKSFSEKLCQKVGCYNGYPYIKIIEEKVPKHLGGEGKVTYSLDKQFFFRKNVFVFDDIVTRGESMLRFTEKLLDVGANIIFVISIGRTFFDSEYDHRPSHPYTGTIC